MLPVTGIVGGSGMPMPAFTLLLETGVWRSGELVMQKTRKPRSNNAVTQATTTTSRLRFKAQRPIRAGHARSCDGGAVPLLEEVVNIWQSGARI